MAVFPYGKKQSSLETKVAKLAPAAQSLRKNFSTCLLQISYTPSSLCWSFVTFWTKDSSTVLSKVMTLHQGPVLPRWCCNSDSPKPLHTLETWLSSTILVGLRLPGLSILFMHILEFLHTNQYQSIERMPRWLVLHLLHLGEVAFPGIKTNIRCLGNRPTHVTVQTFPASTSDLANPKVTRSGG